MAKMIASKTLPTYTTAKGYTFNRADMGPSYGARWYAWMNPFPGQLGETFKVVFVAFTRKELREKMEAYK